MFWFFPFLQGRDLDYREYFALITALIALAVSFVFYFLALFCFYLSTSKVQEIASGYMRISALTSSCAYEVCAFIAAFALTFTVCCLSIFDFVWVGWTVLAAAGIMGWRFLQWCRSCHAGGSPAPHESCFSRIFRTLAVVEQTRPGQFYALLVLTLLIVVGFPLISEGLCICYYNSDMGISSGSGALSTRFTRWVTMPESCKKGPPCHVYATLPEDSAHFIFINAQTSPIYTSLTVHYGLSPSSLSLTQAMSQYEVAGLDAQTDRHVFSCLLSNLTSSTQYYLQIEYADSQYSQVYWFRTMPEAGPVRFAAGGDMGNNQFAYTISKRAGEQTPAVGFVGGDLAYDNNFRTCARTWDLLLDQWTAFMGSDPAQLVPLVFSLGNHDVGLESLSGHALPMGADRPLYFTFFPQHFARDLNGDIVYAVPEVDERKSYFRHSIGNAAFYTLDSGYVANYTGEQLTWMKSQMQEDTAKWKFAQYHLPVYASIPLDPDEKFPSGEALKFWVPLFDEFGFAVIFENHVHSFKRTVPLSCSLEDPNGVVYVGDGQWGAGSQTTPNPGFDQDPDIFLKEGLKFHVWIADLSDSAAAFTAIGLNPGDIVDSFQLQR